MKKLIVFSIIFFALTTLHAQKKFDEKVGKEILKLFPDKIKDKDTKKGNDRVKDAKGFMGVIVHRDYGNDKQKVRVEAINNSPSLVAVNAFLNNPISDAARYKIVVINGYKGLIQTLYGENSVVNYELLIPITATLLSVRTYGYNRDELIALAAAIPVAKIGELIGK